MSPQLPLLVDLHEDISFYYVMGGYGLKFRPEDFYLDIEGRHADIPKFKKANLKLVVASIAYLIPSLEEHRIEQLSKGYGITSFSGFRVRSPTMLAMEHIKSYYSLAKKHDKDIKLVIDSKDVKSFDDGKIKFLIAMEGAEPLEDIGDIEIFYRLGLRSLQLTWNFDNKYAATCMSKKDYGLTGDGEMLVEACNELGIVLDLAHASKKATIEAIKLSKLPCMVSHANCKSLKDHPRNLDDEQLEAIEENQGVIGITLIPPTLGEEPSVKTVADHIMYLYESFSSDIIAIGTDYFGLIDVGEPKGLEDITKIRNLWEELLNRGIKENDLEKISGLNALRVIRANSDRWPRGLC